MNYSTWVVVVMFSSHQNLRKPSQSLLLLCPASKGEDSIRVPTERTFQMTSILISSRSRLPGSDTVDTGSEISKHAWHDLRRPILSHT